MQLLEEMLWFFRDKRKYLVYSHVTITEKHEKLKLKGKKEQLSRKKYDDVCKKMSY